MKKYKYLTILFVCAIHIAFSQKLEFSTSLIPEELTTDANSIIRLDNTFIELKSQKSKSVIYERVTTVLNKYGDKYSDLTIYYDNKLDIKSVKMYVYDKNGKEIKKIKKSDFSDYSASDGFSLYNDGRLIHYDYTPTVYPYTVYYRYEIQTSNTGFISSWSPINGYVQSVVKSTFTFSYPTDIAIKKHDINFQEFNVIDKSVSNLIKYEVENVKVIKYEPYAPPINTLVPISKISIAKFNVEGIDGSASDWKEFGKWQYEHFYKDVGGVSEVVKQKMIELTKDANSNIEKAKLIYRYVQDKVRYISVQVGIGGLRPMLAKDVDRLAYGDCKALTNYTKSLLDAVGVESYFTELYGGNEKENMKINLPSVHGNHVILNLPNGEEDIWLECTSQTVPFGHIAGFTDDRDVIVVKPDGGVLKHTTVYSEVENKQHIRGKYTIDNVGGMKGYVNIESGGNQFDNHLHYESLNNKEKEKRYKEFWDNIDNMTIQKIELNNDRDLGIFIERIEFTAENYGVISGERMIFLINAFNVWEHIPKRIRNRKLPVEISRGFYDVDEVEIDLPDGFKIEAMNNDQILESEFGKYVFSVEKVSEKKLKLKRELLLKAGKYPKEKYEAYRNFFRQIVKNDNSKIVLIKE